ncbi:thioredoxin domain-containing protein [Lentzea sp. BCCO 10_0061]|uniref:Thioredoxin domain-containing protein n=1 Tax=Lentzea sokolovensis TaxID=3095429 RepID=A0ABU4UVH9_9PSEU|nr:thioredoxin domain-containing protein [Lentzea sp. BCCO 10_0061]MDX8143162.1 thioredoxin domain-containing protein [Lentzea sp. BCCO 10_0061]
MTKNARISLIIVTVVVVVVGGFILLSRLTGPSGSQQPAGSTSVAGPTPIAPNEVLVRPDSHKLNDAPNAKVTVVEFLDFECESCRAAYPGVEKLRGEYGDRVTFVMRYFPIPSHRNAELAATVVEAASKQGKLDAMYQRMYETQQQWGEKQVLQHELFVSFARDLGLDMTKFEADLNDPATLERVLKDRKDGTTVGVQGTPTFFINGTKFQGAPSYDGLKAAIERELAK